MTLTELKAKATELGLTPDEVRHHGSLSKKATWEVAIAKFEEMKVTDIEPSTDITVTVNQPAVDDLPFDNPTHTLIDGEWVLCSEIVNPSQLPELAATDPRFESWQSWMIPGATFTTGRQIYEILYFDPWGNCHAKGDDTHWHSFRIETIVNTATDDFVQKSKPIPSIEPECDMEGWYRWDEKLKHWIKEDPNQSLENCYQPESESLRQQLLKRMEPYVGDCIRLEDFEQLQNEPLDEDTAAVYLGWLEAGQEILAEALAV